MCTLDVFPFESVHLETVDFTVQAWALVPLLPLIHSFEKDSSLLYGQSFMRRSCKILPAIFPLLQRIRSPASSLLKSWLANSKPPLQILSPTIHTNLCRPNCFDAFLRMSLRLSSKENSVVLSLKTKKLCRHLPAQCHSSLVQSGLPSASRPRSPHSPPPSERNSKRFSKKAVVLQISAREPCCSSPPSPLVQLLSVPRG